jgi:hypothetical protein
MSILIKLNSNNPYDIICLESLHLITKIGTSRIDGFNLYKYGETLLLERKRKIDKILKRKVSNISLLVDVIPVDIYDKLELISPIDKHFLKKIY